MDFIPEESHPKGDSKNETPNLDILPVYDLHANGWRSFRLDRLISAKVL